MDFTVNPNGYVCYYRISTGGRQKTNKETGGLPWYRCQQEACQKFLQKREAQIIGEFHDIASGVSVDSRGRSVFRPSFSQAIKTCLDTGATLFSERVDRICRELEIALALEHLGIKIFTIDMYELDEEKCNMYNAMAKALAESRSTPTPRQYFGALARATKIQLHPEDILIAEQCHKSGVNYVLA